MWLWEIWVGGEGGPELFLHSQSTPDSCECDGDCKNQASSRRVLESFGNGLTALVPEISHAFWGAGGSLRSPILSVLTPGDS